MYFYREYKKILEATNPIITDSFVSRIRLLCFLLSCLLAATVFSYPFRFFAVVVVPLKSSSSKIYKLFITANVLALVLISAFLSKETNIITYGILVSLALVIRDFVLKSPPDPVQWFFEFLCFWAVVVPLFFETNYSPLLFVFICFPEVFILWTKSKNQSKPSWEKSQYVLHTFDNCAKLFWIVFVLVMVGFGIWLGMVYGYQFFWNLFGKYISF